MTESQFVTKFGEQWRAAHPGGFYHKIHDAFHLGGRKPFDAFAWYTDAGALKAFAWEFKMHKKHTAFPFSQVEDHQLDGLRRAAVGGAEAVLYIAVRFMLDLDQQGRLELPRRQVHVDIILPIGEVDTLLATGQRSVPVLPYIKESMSRAD